MSALSVAIRQAAARDLPGIAHVRASVTENAPTVGELAARGITEQSIAASFLADSKGWVGEEAGRIVAFSIADRKSRSIFGSADDGEDTRAARFYAADGWSCVIRDARGELRFEISWPGPA